MFRSQFSKPAPGLSQFIRFYVQREVRNRGAFVAHAVRPRDSDDVFEFGDPIEALYCNQPPPVKSPGVVVVARETYHRLEMHLRGALETFAIIAFRQEVLDGCGSRVGYHDQMHMIHDFAEFTGGIPSDDIDAS